MKFTPIISLLGLAALAQAAVNGRCSNGGSLNGICISTTRCAQSGGVSDPGHGPNSWTCPGTPADVQCCSIIPRCPGLGTDTLCTWDNRCTSIWPAGKILPNPVCPGGNDFVCCDING